MIPGANIISQKASVASINGAGGGGGGGGGGLGSTVSLSAENVGGGVP